MGLVVPGAGEKYTTKSIQWSVLKNTNEMVLANGWTVSASSEARP